MKLRTFFCHAKSTVNISLHTTIARAIVLALVIDLYMKSVAALFVSSASDNFDQKSENEVSIIGKTTVTKKTNIDNYFNNNKQQDQQK